jgi:acyl carrier protein
MNFQDFRATHVIWAGLERYHIVLLRLNPARYLQPLTGEIRSDRGITPFDDRAIMQPDRRNNGRRERQMGAMTHEELALASMIVDVLNLEDTRPEDIEPDEPLFDGGLGLDSIDALEIAVALAQKYGVHLKAEDEETKSIFATLRSLSEYVTQRSSLQAG